MRICRVPGLVSAILISACGGGTEPTPPPPPPPPAPVSLSAVTPQSQSAPVGQSLYVTVKVTTTNGAPVQGAAVGFEVTGGGGSVSPTLVVSNGTGLATAGWIIGSLAGMNTLSATVTGATPLQLTVAGTPAPAAAVLPVAGNGQTATVATAVPVAPAVQVRDPFGNGVANVAVTFAVSGGGGSIAGSTTATNQLGVATAGTWTLGTVSGANTLTATAAGLVPVAFTATATAGTAVRLAIQVPPIGGPSGVALSQQPTVQVVDPFGNLVTSDNGRLVSAAITPGGDGALTGTATAPTVNGTATFSNLLIVGAPAGVRTLTFSAIGLAPVVSGGIALSPSPPLTVTDITPSVLIPGGTAIVIGTGFNATPSANIVTVDGVAVPVSGASPSQLTVTLPSSGFPCTPLHYAVVAVANGANSAASTRQLQTGIPRPMPVGEVQLLLNDSELACNELISGGQYILTVFNTSVGPGAVGFQVRGGRFGAGPAPETVSAPAIAPASLRRRQSDTHMAHLGYERARYARVGRAARAAWQALRGGPPTRGASLVTPTVGATSQVRFAFDGSATTLLTVRTAFVGPHVTIVEDQAISPTFGVKPFDAFYAQLGNEFETRMYPILTTNFGNPLAMDALMHNTGRIVLVFSPSVSVIGGPGGFVTGCDLLVVAMCDASNEAPTAYLTVPDVGDPADSIAFWKSLMLLVVQHEAKHITALAEKTSRGAAALEEVWLEEGTAEVALEIYGRQLCGFAPKARTSFAALTGCEDSGTTLPPLTNVPALIEILGLDLYDYLRQFEVASPFGGQTINGQVVPFHYESAWSLARWAADAFGGSDAAFFKSLTQDIANQGMANLAAHTGQSPGTLIGLWTMMFDTDDRGDFTSADPKLTFPNWRIRDLLAGVRQGFGLTTPDWPLNVRFPSAGGWAYNVQFLVAGAATHIELGAAGDPQQVFELRAAIGTPLRIGLHRIK